MAAKNSTSKSPKNSTGKKTTQSSGKSKKTSQSSSRTQGSLDKNLSTLTTSKQKKSNTTSTKKSTKTGRGSTAIKIIQSRKKDMFPMMNMYKFPYHFEPGPEIQDRLNKAWFDEHYGEERMKEHIRKHKLKSHQYKAYVNYWWLKEQQKG